MISVRTAAIALALGSVSLVDADLRGPLAAPADVWIAGHETEAERRLEALDPVDRRGLGLPGSDRRADDAGPQTLEDLDHALFGALHDDDARRVYRAAWLADRDRTAEALAELRVVADRRTSATVDRVLNDWSQR